MQHKGLFVALCCGALCLTGCIKNIESESVTKIREATASKLLSEAELNKAQAEAAKIKANAEATIADAQAKLIEAQAAKEEAEAKLIEAKAELQKINNEIAKVKLDEEREELKRKKAEVEKQIAEYEAAIAWAAVAQQAAIDMMEQMANEAELNALKHQVEILQQKQNIVAEASKLNSDLRKRLIHAWDKYNDYSDKYYKAQAELILAQTKLARLEAGMESNYEATVEAIVEKQNEIAFLELQVEELESYVTYTSEEVEEALKGAEMTLAAAKTAELEAYQDYSYFNNEVNTLYNQAFTYTQNWAPLVQFANSLIESEAFIPVAMEIGERSVAGFGYQGQFLPLFTGDVNDHDNPTGLVADNSIKWYFEGYEKYPETVEGKKPTYWAYIPQGAYIPAYISTESFEWLLGYMETGIDLLEANAVKNYYATKDNPRELKRITETVLPRLEEKLNYYTEYVEAAEPEVVPLATAAKAAGEIWTASLEDMKEAREAVETYKFVHSAELANKPLLEAEMNAMTALLDAQDVVDDTQKRFEAAVENLKTLKAEVQEIADAKYIVDLLEANSGVAVDSLETVLNPETGKVGKPFAVAQKAVADQRQAINAQEAATAKSLAAYRKAEVDYIKDPTHDERATTKSAWEADTAKLGKLNRDLIPMLEDLQKAETPFQETMDEYLSALATYSDAQKSAKIYATKLATALEQLGKPKTETEEATGAFKRVADAKKASDDAKAALGEKIEALATAHAANTDGDVSEEFIMLYVDVLNAADAFSAASRALGKAFGEYYTVIFTKYPYYVEYSNQIDPEESDWETPEIGNDEPEQLYAKIAWYNAKAVVLEQIIEKEIKAEVYDHYDLVRAALADAEHALEIIGETEEEYFAHVAQLNEVEENSIIAYMSYMDATNATAEVEAQCKALYTLLQLYEAVYVDVSFDAAGNPQYVNRGIEWLESVINNLKAQIAEKEAELDKLMDEAELGKVIDVEGHEVTEIEAYIMLVAKIERLESEINQYLALMDAYSAEIDIIMEAIESEADVD